MSVIIGGFSYTMLILHSTTRTVRFSLVPPPSNNGTNTPNDIEWPAQANTPRCIRVCLRSDSRSKPAEASFGTRYCGSETFEEAHMRCGSIAGRSGLKGLHRRVWQVTACVLNRTACCVSFVATTKGMGSKVGPVLWGLGDVFPLAAFGPDGGCR